MFLKKQFFILLFSIATLSAFGLLTDILYYIAFTGLCLLAIATIADITMLLRLRIEGGRTIASKVDLGEENTVHFTFCITRGILRSAYIIDELPTEFMKSEKKLSIPNYQFSPRKEDTTPLAEHLSSPLSSE